MEMAQLLEIQQQLFFEFGHKIDLYDFPRVREIVVLKHGDFFNKNNIIKVFKY